jgi:D-sedoheptulose 7-phosphate isomerase
MYLKNYVNSINNGLIESTFKINQKTIDGDAFFEKLVAYTNEVELNKGRIFFFGNGASAAFANHMALDFSKNGGILSRSLSDSALLTALANDYSYEQSMVEFLKIEQATKDDLIITISSSGNSPNIINALNYAKANKIQSLSLSGLKSDNKSIKLSNHSIYVPMKTYGMVECIHQVLLHLMLDESMGIFEWDRSDYQNMNIKSFNL